MSSETFWVGTLPTRCEVCNSRISQVVIDGKLKIGPWAIMCPTCSKEHGVGLGTGKGQKYQRQSDGRYLKVAG